MKRPDRRIVRNMENMMENVKTIAVDAAWPLPRLQALPATGDHPIQDAVLFTRAEIEHYEWLDK